MNRSELSSRVAADASLSKAGADSVIDAVFSTITDTLARGESVAIAGFGTFTPRARAARGQGAIRKPVSPSPSPPRRCRPSRPERLFATRSGNDQSRRFLELVHRTLVDTPPIHPASSQCYLPPSLSSSTHQHAQDPGVLRRISRVRTGMRRLSRHGRRFRNPPQRIRNTLSNSQQRLQPARGCQGSARATTRPPRPTPNSV